MARIIYFILMTLVFSVGNAMERKRKLDNKNFFKCGIGGCDYVAEITRCRNHQFSHTNQWPFQCSTCKKSAEKTVISAHIRHMKKKDHNHTFAKLETVLLSFRTQAILEANPPIPLGKDKFAYLLSVLKQKKLKKTRLRNAIGICASIPTHNEVPDEELSLADEEISFGPLLATHSAPQAPMDPIFADLDPIDPSFDELLIE